MTSKTTSYMYPKGVIPPNKNPPSKLTYGAWFRTGNLTKKVETNFAHFNVTAKSGSYKKPSLIRTRKYGFKVPTYADIASVIIADNHHNQTFSSDTASPAVDTVTHKVMNGSKVLTQRTQKKRYTKQHFQKINIPNNGSLTPKIVNSEHFGLNIEFGANKNSNPGRFQFRYAAMQVQYILPEYRIQSRIVSDVDNLKIGDTVEMEFVLSNKAKTSYNPQIDIVLPSGVSFVEKRSGDGTILKNESNLKWDAKVKKGDSTKRIIIACKLSEDGDKEIGTKVTIPSSSITASCKLKFHVTGKIVKIKCTTDMVHKIDLLKDYSFRIDMSSPIPFDSSKYKVELVLNDEIFNVKDFFVVKSSKRCSYTFKDNILNIRPDLTSNEQSFIEMVFSTPMEGKFEIVINVINPDDVEIHSEEFESIAIDPLSAHGIFYKVPPEKVWTLGNGINYEVSMYIKCDNTLKLIDTDDNFRIAIFNSELPEVSSDEELLRYIRASEEVIVYDSDEEDYISDDEFVEQKIHFNYNEEYDVYILMFFDFFSLEHVKVQFSSPTIIETSEKKDNNPICIFPSYGGQSIVGSQYTLDPLAVTNPLRLYDFQSAYAEDYYILGLEVKSTLRFDSPDNHLIWYGEMNADPSEEETTIKTAVYDEAPDGTDPDIIDLQLGEEMSKWGLPSESRKIEHLGSFQFDSKFRNNGKQKLPVTIENFQFLISIIQPEEERIKIWVDGEDLSLYGVHVHKVKLPFGLNTNTRYIEETVTDDHAPYLQSINTNEIEIEFSMCGERGCELTENSLALSRVAKLFTSQRDVLNKPEIKTLQLDMLPNRVFHFISEEGIDSEIQIGSYECKAKLTLTDGTYENAKPVVTGYTGTNEGISNVRPLIVLENIKPFIWEDGKTDFSLELIETSSEQVFWINDFRGAGIDETELYEGKIMIDCDERTVEFESNEEYEDDSNIIDLTKYVDFASDWFFLSGDFTFEVVSNNAELHSVTFMERGN